MASRTSPGHVGLDRPPVIVATQARRIGMNSFERVSRLLFMIKTEIVAQLVPPLGQMADTAVAGKLRMRHQRTPFLLVPALLRHEELAAGDSQSEQKKGPDEYLQTRSISFGIHDNPHTYWLTDDIEQWWFHPSAEPGNDRLCSPVWNAPCRG